MGNLQIKNVPEDVHAELRRRATDRGMTQRDYMLELIRRDQERPTWAEWQARRKVRKPIDLGASGAELIRQVREERERPLSDRRR